MCNGLGVDQAVPLLMEVLQDLPTASELRSADPNRLQTDGVVSSKLLHQIVLAEDASSSPDSLM